MIQHFEVKESRPKCDLHLVDRIGYVDLRVSYESGVVSGDLDSVEGNFNGITDPSSVLGCPDDVFAAIRARESYSGSGQPSADVTPVAENGA